MDACLWLPLHRSLFVAGSFRRWGRQLHLCPRVLGYPALASPAYSSRRSSTATCADLLYRRYEQQTGNRQITPMIVDREGMATEFLAKLHTEGRSVVTILQTNQYRDLSSFADVGTFVPLSTDTHG